jgi:hypothetical protein
MVWSDFKPNAPGISAMTTRHRTADLRFPATDFDGSHHQR